MNSSVRYGFGLAVFAASWCHTLPAMAVVVNGTTSPLGSQYDPIVLGEVALSAAAYSQVLTAPGTLYLNPPIYVPGGAGAPGCDANNECNVGTGEISAVLGADPTILLSTTPLAGPSGSLGVGNSYLSLTYYVQYSVPGAPLGTTVLTNVMAADILAIGAIGTAEADMTISDTTIGNNAYDATVYSAYDCVSSAGGSGCNAGATPFANAPVTLFDNDIYKVALNVSIYSNSPVSAEIDPTFTTSDTSGLFVYSAGVGAPVPEPASWLVMLTMTGAGAALSRRIRR